MTVEELIKMLEKAPDRKVQNVKEAPKWKD